MKDNSADIGRDIVGYAAKTEELKAELLQSIASVFRQTAMGSRAALCEEEFAHAAELLLMLANRRGIDLQRLGTELNRQARTGMVRCDDYSADHRAVLAFIGGK
ncbi:MAG: hypothetical protein IKS17_07685 [Firmicutes bacterium]|nr:hypothetical protein [Bacillota bacterium]